MKNISIIGLLSVALFFCFEANAQVKFGIKAGANASLQNVAPKEFSSSPFIGMMGGVFIRIPVSEKIQIQPEVMLSSQGVNSSFKVNDNATIPFTTLNVYSKVNNSMNYLNLPVMLRYNLTKKLSLELGYQVGVFLWGKSEINANISIDGPIPQNIDQSETKYLKTRDVNVIDQSIVGGFSYEIDNGLELNIRVQQGLNGVYKQSEFIEDIKTISSGAVDIDVTDIRNAMIQVGVSYSFLCKKNN